MEIEGKIIKILELKSGISKAGKEWKSQEFVIETTEQYSKSICFSLFGDKIDKNELKLGEKCTVDFDISSREYNDRWYTEARAWKIDLITESNIAANDFDFLSPSEGEEEPF